MEGSIRLRYWGLGGNVWQQAVKSSVPVPPKFDPIISLIDELLSIVGEVPIDCEFAITQESVGEVYGYCKLGHLFLD